MFAAVDDQLGLSLLAGAGGRGHGAVASRRRGGIADEAADAGVLADRCRGPTVGDRLRAQRQLQMGLAGTRRRLLVHRQHVRQHGGRRPTATQGVNMT